MCFRRNAKNVFKAMVRLLQLMLCPFLATLTDVILPDNVIPGMNSAFKARFLNGTHFSLTGTDIWCRQEYAIHQGFKSIMLNDRGTGNFLEKTRPEGAAERPASVVFAQ